MAQVVDSVVSQTIHDLQLKYVEDFSEVMEVVDEVMSLLSVLKRIHWLLNHSYTNALVARSAETIRDLAYKIEDVLETCSVDAAEMVQNKESWGSTRRFSWKRYLRKCFPAQDDGYVLEKIKAKISELDRDIVKFCKDFPEGANDEPPLVASRGQRWLRQLHPRSNKRHFVGMNDELEKLVSLVVGEEHLVVEEENLVVVGEENLVVGEEKYGCWGGKSICWGGKSCAGEENLVIGEEKSGCWGGKSICWGGKSCAGEENLVVGKEKSGCWGGKSICWGGKSCAGEENLVTGEENLVAGEENLVVGRKTRVISLWGVPGLGKTTIARKIYNHPKVRDSFKAFAWVFFTEGCEINIILPKILRQLGPRKINETAQEETMIDQLKEVQTQKNCLIVLDNIQDIDHWGQLSPAFQVEGGGSVILLTTRETNVANDIYHHKLRFLDENEGWDLLKKHAFPRKDGPDIGRFPRIGKAMVRKCEYLPSAISKLGRILSNKISLDDWKMVNKNVSEYLQDHQIERDEQLVTILDSEYDNLPHYLRQCFLYLGNFREDEDIDVEDIYFLWIAEGMVSSVNEARKEPTLFIAKRYKELMDREEEEETTPDIVNEEEMTLDIANEDMEETTLDIANGDRGETTLDIANGNREETTADIANEYREETKPDIVNDDVEDTTLDRANGVTAFDKATGDVLDTTLDIANGDVEETTSEIPNGGVEDTTLDIANGDVEELALDKAERYLTELAIREMVCMQLQENELSAIRTFQSCFLHRPAQELSLREGEKEGFRLKIVDFCGGEQPMLDSVPMSGETRRLAIHFNQQTKLGRIDLLSMDHLQSLFLLNSDEEYVELPMKISDFAKFKLLRVLNFVRCKFDGRKLPIGIDGLINLRYLGLIYCDLDELPSSISSLRKLQVLNVRVLENCHLGIPNDELNQLLLLNHLRLPYYANHVQNQKLKLGGLLDLQTLFGFNSIIHDLDTLPDLKKLRHLGAHAYNNDSLKSLSSFIMIYGGQIRTNLSIENKCNFSSKEGLSILEEVLMCPNLHALTLSMVLIHKFPDCGTHVSSKLTQLKLMGCKIKEDPMEALGKFPNLQKLCIGYGAFIGRKMTIQATGFPKLAYLEIRNLPCFEEWSLDEGAMLNLSTLIIQRCPKLKMIPDQLVSVSNLKHMEIELAPEAFEDVREDEYLETFHFVRFRNIRRVERCSTSYPTSYNSFC